MTSGRGAVKRCLYHHPVRMSSLSRAADGANLSISALAA